MHIDLDQRLISLEPDRPLAIRRGRGVVIECASGRLWVTEADKTGDVFLDAGERWRVATGGLVVVEALKAGLMRLHRPPKASARLLRRLTSAVSGLRIQTDV